MKAKELIKNICIIYNLTDKEICECMAVADKVKESNIFSFADARSLLSYGFPCIDSLSKVKQLELKEILPALQDAQFKYNDFCSMLSFIFDDIRIRIADMYPKSKHSTLREVL